MGMFAASEAKDNKRRVAGHNQRTPFEMYDGALIASGWYPNCYLGKAMKRVAGFVTVSVAVCLLVGCASKPAEKADRFISMGKAHMNERDYARAMLDFKNAAQLLPKDAEPRYQMALAMLAMGDGHGATAEIIKAVELNPKHLAAQLKLAEIMAVNKDLDVVRAGQQRAEFILTESPGNSDALFTLAMTKMRLHQPEDAARHLQEALSSTPNHLQAALGSAVLKLRQGDRVGAEQILTQAVSKAPKSVDHALALAQFYILVNNNPGAEKELRRALQMDPNNGPALATLGGILFRQGNPREAEELFKRSAALGEKQYRPLHAYFLWETGMRDAAIAELQQQYETNKDDREARTRLLGAYIAAGRASEAERILAEALKRNPRDSDALIGRAEILLYRGKYSDAQRDIVESLRFRVDSAEAHFILSRIHRARGVYSSQRQELVEVLKLNPNLVTARIELAQAYNREQLAKSALEIIESAPTNQRQNIQLISERVAAYANLGNNAQARKDLDSALRVSRAPDLLRQDGFFRLKMNEPGKARSSFEEAFRARPDDLQALEGIAVSYVAEKNTTKALSVVREYAAKSPRSPQAQSFLGGWLFRTGDLNGARAAFEAAKALDPQGRAIDFSLAELDLAENNTVSARKRLTALLALEKDNVGWLFKLAEVEMRDGRTSEALKLYEAIVVVDPHNSVALNNLAYLLADTGRDLDRALQMAQQVKELVPNNDVVNDTIGWAYYKKGHYVMAVDYLKAGAGSGNPRRKAHLAMAYLMVGKREEAINLLHTALKDDPSSEEAKEAMQLLANSR